MVQHQARFNNRGALFCIDLQNIAYIFAVVNHQACPRGLSALASATTARHDRHAEVSAYVHSYRYFLGALGDKHT